MAGYRTLGEVELAWKEAREVVSLQGRWILRRVLDQALTELDHQFQEAVANGEVLTVSVDSELLKQLLLEGAQRELGPGNVSNKS